MSPNLLTKPQRNRLTRRLIYHHVPLFLVSSAAVLMIYTHRPSPDFWSKASFATAYPALFLVLASLAIGPTNVLLRRPNPISIDLRRDIGIWAGILSIAHTVIGQNVHLRGRPWLYYIYAPREHHWFPIRHDAFGFANYTGLACTLLVAALLATSNDYALRRLGARQWKSLQRWNYAAFALAAAHAYGYQEGVEHQHLPWVLLISVGIALTLAIQIAGWLRRRNHSPA